MKHLDLFSGIGGFALAARNVGWQTVQFVEVDSWCQAVLAKNFPGVPIHGDITTYRGEPGTADIVTGGFPCQDISHAGKQAGIEGERSGLWTELARVIGEIRPRYAVLENVSALLSGDKGRWFQRVLGDLAEIGYDCEWHCIPASHVGAPHRRDRIWIICYPGSEQYEGGGNAVRREAAQEFRDPNSESEPFGTVHAKASGLPENMADTNSNGRHEDALGVVGQSGSPGLGLELLEKGKNVSDTNGPRLAQRLVQKVGRGNIRQEGETVAQGSWWSVEPDVGRVANGVPRRVDRLRGLGNAIVPQVAEMIFQAIIMNPLRNGD